MRAFQSRSSAMVSSATGSALRMSSPNTSNVSSNSNNNVGNFPVATRGFYTTATQRPSYRCDINSLLAPSSLGLFTQRAGCATTPGATVDTTKAVAGMSGYSDNEYNEASDHFLAAIEEAMVEFEECDDGRVEDVDMQAGVLNIQTSKGTFILNKQAPKLQLWLSSPISGPTHYSMVKNSEEGSSGHWWKCDRHGNNLEELLGKELGSVLSLDGPLKFNL